MTAPGGAAAAVWVSVLPDVSNFGATLVRDLAGAGGNAGDRLGSEMGRATESSFSKAAKGIAVAGAAVGAALGVALVGAMNVEAANDKLSAQLGLSAKDAERYGQVAGDLYSANYGDSLETVNEALRQVTLNVGGTATASDTELSKITASVLDVATAFDQDLGGTTVAVGQLMKNGLAPNATAALDLITVGFQKGADKSGDFLDTLNEYGGQFAKLGIDGATATGLLSQGLQAGARDADLVADAVKEFSIRAVDGSKATGDGFRALGLDGAEMARKIAAGGPEASGALDLVLDRLREMPDPVQRSQTAVALFGTQAEDLGAALFALDPSTAVDTLGQVGGAADRMGQTLNDNAAGNLESFKRQVVTAFVDIVGGKVLPIVADVAAFLASTFGPALAVLGGVLAGAGAAFAEFGGWVQRNREWLEPLAVGVGVFVLAVNASAIATALWGVATGVASTVMGVARGAVLSFQVAMWLLNAAMSANPIGIVVALLAGLVAGLIWAWNNSETFRNIVIGAWEAIKSFTETVFGAVRDFIVTVWTAISSFFTAVWSGIAAANQAIWGGIGAFFTGLFTGIRDLVVSVWTGISTFFSTIFGFISGLVTTVWGAITGYFTAFFHAHEELIMGIWNAISGFLSTIWNAISGVAVAVFTAVSAFFTTIWTAISTTVTTVWNAISSFLSAAFAVFTGFFTTVWNGIVAVFTTVWNAISSVATTVWNAISSFFVNAFNFYRDLFTNVWNAISTVFSTVWNGISSAAISIWNGISGFFTGAFNAFTGFFSGIWNGIVASFESIFGKIRGIAESIWNGVKDVFRGGVNVAIDAINWLSDKLNIVLKFFLIDPIPPIPRLASGGVLAGDQVTMMARGGAMPVGAGFATNGAVAIVGEGNPNHPEYVIPTDPTHRKRALDLFADLGAQLLAEGGTLGRNGPLSGSAGGNVVGSASGAIKLSDPLTWLADGAISLANSIVDGLTSVIPPGMFRDIASGIGHKVVGAMKALVDKTAATQVAAAGGGTAVPSGPIVDVVRATAAQFGWGTGPQWDALGWIISHESGWNPNAQNPHSTAYGLFQFLDGTWASTGIGKTSNPSLQALAGMRYIGSRYQSPIGAKAFWQSHGWYKTGGYFDSPSMIGVGEAGAERLLSPRQTIAFERLVAALDTPPTPTGMGFNEKLEQKLDELLAALRSLPIGITVEDRSGNPVELAQAVKFALRMSR